MGAPRSAYADDDFVIVRGDAVRALGDYNTAGLFQRIAWRAERNGGSWRASMREIADEVWLTQKQVRRSLDVLRSNDWIRVDRSGDLDQTHVYSVVWDEPGANAFAPEGTGSAPQGTGGVPSRANVPLIETLTETETPTGAEAPRSAQTLVAEWLDHCQQRPPARVIGQVARELGLMLDEGIDYDTVRQGLGLWHRKALHPSALASVVNEVMHPRTHVQSSSKPTPTERAAEIHRMGQELAQARREREQAASNLYGMTMKGIEQ